MTRRQIGPAAQYAILRRVIESVGVRLEDRARVNFTPMKPPEAKAEEQNSSIDCHRPIHGGRSGVNFRRPEGEKDANDTVCHRDEIHRNSSSPQSERAPADSSVSIGHSFEEYEACCDEKR